MEFHWEEGFRISTRIDDDAIVISANRAGLVSLVNHLLTLADGGPCGHFHLDEYNPLEDGSCELIVERIPDLIEPNPTPAPPPPPF